MKEATLKVWIDDDGSIMFRTSDGAYEAIGPMDQYGYLLGLVASSEYNKGKVIKDALVHPDDLKVKT